MTKSAPATSPSRLETEAADRTARLCCMEAAQRALAPARDQLRDTDADGLPEIAHTIERFHGNCDFGHAAGVVAGFQDISDHALVTTDCRFDLRAHVIAGGLLPIHAPMLFDRKDMPVALGRRCCGSWSRHGPLAWRNDETGARVSGENGVENSTPIIGVIDIFVGQIKCDDLAAVCVKTNMQFAPGAAFRSSMFFEQPFAGSAQF